MKPRPDLLFNIDGSHLLGLGQGGPQFDRRGHADSMVSGQGGYQLATHGARVPIQFLIGNRRLGHVRACSSWEPLT